MEPTGTHILAEYSDCDPGILDNADAIVDLLHSAAGAAGASVVTHRSYRVSSDCLACIIILMESHMSVRSWPSAGHASVDLYTCGHCNPRNAIPLNVNTQ